MAPKYKHPADGPILKVNGRQSISIRNKLYGPDDIVGIAVLETLDGEEVSRLIENEVLVPIGVPRTPQPKPGASSTVLSVDRAPAKPPESVAPPSARSAHKWSLDPADLAKLSLEQLNVKLAEMEPSAAPFADADEARAFLSQDFAQN